jgi:hypothetical protein
LKKAFCASAWAEGVLGNHGEFRICAKQYDSIENWQIIDLAKVYNSKNAKLFRKNVIKGIPPNAICKNCIDTNTTRNLSIILYRGTVRALKGVRNNIKENNFNFQQLETIYQILNNNYWTPELWLKVKKYKIYLNNLIKKYYHAKPFLLKLKKIIKICESYFNRTLTVPVIIAMRQVSLKNKCNAKCIHCPGKYNGWIFKDDALEECYYKQSLSYPGDITDFFMNGSEFLFVKNWQYFAQLLNEANVKPSISTNGILLSENNIKYLIDKQYLDELTISIDGAKKETIESIRINVNFEKLINNIKYLLSYAKEKRYYFTLTFSFVLMKRNYKEFPEMIKLICDMKKDMNIEMNCPLINFGCTDLDPFDISGYNEFVSDEHIDNIDLHELINMFKKCKEYSDFYNVPVFVFKVYDINNFISAGCPIPQRAMHHKKIINLSGNNLL